MKAGDIVNFKRDGYDTESIAIDFRITVHRANKILYQSAKILEVVNDGTHAIVGYLDGSQELVPIYCFEPYDVLVDYTYWSRG